MPFAVSTVREAGYLRFNVSGPASLKNYFDLVDEAVHQSIAAGATRGMVDLRGVVGRLQFTDQFFIGEVVANKLGHMNRVATLVAADPGSYNSPKVATRMGVQLQTFDDEGVAIEWLMSP